MGGNQEELLDTELLQNAADDFTEQTACIFSASIKAWCTLFLNKHTRLHVLATNPTLDPATMYAKNNLYKKRVISSIQYLLKVYLNKEMREQLANYVDLSKPTYKLSLEWGMLSYFVRKLLSNQDKDRNDRMTLVTTFFNKNTVLQSEELGQAKNVEGIVKPIKDHSNNNYEIIRSYQYTRKPCLIHIYPEVIPSAKEILVTLKLDKMLTLKKPIYFSDLFALYSSLQFKNAQTEAEYAGLLNFVVCDSSVSYATTKKFLTFVNKRSSRQVGRWLEAFMDFIKVVVDHNHNLEDQLKKKSFSWYSTHDTFFNKRIEKIKLEGIQKPLCDITQKSLGSTQQNNNYSEEADEPEDSARSKAQEYELDQATDRLELNNTQHSLPKIEDTIVAPTTSQGHAQSSLKPTQPQKPDVNTKRSLIDSGKKSKSFFTVRFVGLAIGISCCALTFALILNKIGAINMPYLSF